MKHLIAITGPTASGKTRQAVALARELDGEIISADSRQLYRGMDIGTGKDLSEYGDVPYHLTDVAEAGERWNLHDYLFHYHSAFNDIVARDCQPILCGGTGLYLEHAVGRVELPQVPENPQLREDLKDLTIDQLAERLASLKQLHNVTDLDTTQRAIRAIEIAEYMAAHPDVAALTRPHPDPKSIIIALDIPRDDRRRRIEARLDARLQEGMIDEVKRLLDSGLTPDQLIYYGLEYKFVTLHIIGQLTYAEMREQLLIAIRQFAKRQMTWLRGMERRGWTLHWLPYDLPPAEFVTCVLTLAHAHGTLS
ncbi:MAG: tRNA (adenosine(37)-N6)-dimethylallyltransferase MiaA [Bacteroidales bacterium]|nr:tRNA (adenosine(37)-N6)-dimethylallyltransferase MiaA [Bacteroidales bacterium]